MSLPVLDKESYQYMCSDWVSQAGNALKQAGYLDTEPTGTYDEAFAAAVAAFQADQNITEEDQVGPQTWAALGVLDHDTGEEETAPESTLELGQLSDDGQWEWDGTQWIAADRQSVDQTLEAGHVSEDGQWQWDGTQWVATPTSTPAATAAADPGLEVFTGDARYIIYPDEVRSGGTIAWRARNPGNIRRGEKYGAYAGKKANTPSNGSFAVFPDEQTGFEAIKQVLKGYGNVTVAKAMNKYAPAGDGANDPDAYARKVAKAMGVTIDTSVQTLDDDQMQTFAEAIKKVEGWREGTTWALDDERLPDAVKKAIRGE